MARRKSIVAADHQNSRKGFLTDWRIMVFSLLLQLCTPSFLYAEEQPSEYRLKVAFLYNFAAYTTWPNPPDRNLTLCIHGEDPFGQNLQHLHGKKINEHDILIKYTRNIIDLTDCHMVFITQSVIKDVDDIIKQLQGMPILTIADSPGAGRRGVVLNMAIKEGKVTFEANIAMAGKNRLNLSSQLLRFASEVHQ
ncbi:YfiR family protein [Nitrosomonas sp. wSCUT-2]